MNEVQWQVCSDAEKMLCFLRGEASERKHRLFVVAVFRRLQWFWDRAVETAECYADGLVSLRELMEVRMALLQNARSMYRHMGREDFEAVEKLIRVVTDFCAAQAASMVVEVPTVVQRVILCDLLREIFDNPFRPVTISPTYRSWNDATVVRLAQATYDNRILPAGTLDNARLAVLADALEEAGCSDEHILTHLRSGGEHYRGCFVVDALLGKN